MKKQLLILILGISFFSYSRSLNLPDSTFYLENDGARMPLIVRGNADSKVIILFLHGGPGGTAMKKIGCKAFLELEQEFRVVYWDQRGSVFCKGGDERKYLTLDQYTDDLDHVVDHLKRRMPDHSIFLMGHCWGGALGTAYLSEPVHHAKVTGWIDVAGAHNNPLGDSLSMEWVKAFAREKILKGEQKKYWEQALKWYQLNPEFTSADVPHYMFIKKAHGYVLNESDDNGIYPGYNSSDLMYSPFQFLRYYLNYRKILNGFIISDIDLTASMKNITIPSLIMWGKKDGLIPLPMALEAYKALGTNKKNKTIVVFDNAAHTSYYEQPEAFAKTVKQFVNNVQKREPVH
jgi:proline iminopeptidase